MNRRRFLRLAAAGSLGPALLGTSSPLLAAAGGTHDRFGGWKQRPFKPTGFFRTEHDGDRWWLVTPAGNAFISYGINHYHAGWWDQDYNRAHWTRAFGARQAHDKQWNLGFRASAEPDLRRLGLNTLGMHTDAPMLTDLPDGAVVPYLRSFKPLALDHYRRPAREVYVDIFAPEYERHCADVARAVASPYVDDPMLLGYCMADCPVFTDEDISTLGVETSWQRILPNLGANSPGKHAYVTAMRARYTDVAAFNATYGTSFTTWDVLTAAENWRPEVAPSNVREQEDQTAFLLDCVDRYYGVARDALRHVDSNHLFFGDKLNGNTNNLDTVLAVASRHVDVILYQCYGRWQYQKAVLDRLAPRTRLPFLNGDSAYTVPTDMMPAPYGPHARDQAERAAWTLEFCEGAFARPEFVGWHMCGIIDTWKTMPGKSRNQHQGLMTVTGEFYPEMEKAVRQISHRLYGLASTRGARPSSP